MNVMREWNAAGGLGRAACRWLVAFWCVVAGSIAGSAWAGMRLDPDFGFGGKVLTDIGVSSMDVLSTLAVQRDGKLIAGGVTDAYGSLDFVLIRYTETGVLDTSFGKGGIVVSDLGSSSNDSLQAFTIQDDGKIVAVGNSSAGNIAFTFQRTVVVRYNPDGSFDTEFGTNGVVLTDFLPGNSSVAEAVELQSDGKIIVAGYSNTPRDADFSLARYNTDGTLDTTFGTGGLVLTKFGPATVAIVQAILLQADGRIVLAGESSVAGLFQFALARYSKQGKLDKQFGHGGSVLTDLGPERAGERLSHATAIFEQKDGELLVTGLSSSTEGTRFAFVRYKHSGERDSDFHGDGRVRSAPNSNNVTYFPGVAQRSHGKILFPALVWSFGGSDFAILRFDENGKLDKSFGTRGIITSDIDSSSIDIARRVVVQKDGKIVVAGGSHKIGGAEDFALVRYSN